MEWEWEGGGADGFSAATLDLRIPQIGTCFRPLGGEAGEYNETQQVRGASMLAPAAHGVVGCRTVLSAIR